MDIVKPLVNVSAVSDGQEKIVGIVKYCQDVCMEHVQTHLNVDAYQAGRVICVIAPFVAVIVVNKMDIAPSREAVGVKLDGKGIIAQSVTRIRAAKMEIVLAHGNVIVIRDLEVCCVMRNLIIAKRTMMYAKMVEHANHCQKMMETLNVNVCRAILDKGVIERQQHQLVELKSCQHFQCEKRPLKSHY